MWRVIQIVCYVAAPLLYGLAVEYAFERLRRRRASRRGGEVGMTE
ncbi:hypothetical protein LCGC14_1328190 [marine sediment metagenome]|uniref:Uncharacterized protein n=1 Tax=marine sediment metagenome TaxID=412755 RepID=A0A0F9L398_9ZZZZ